ncbi:hypothetical protein GCM10010103_77800 [Streptomyces paradoxus]
MGGIEDRTGQVDQVLLVQELENLLMQSAPDSGTRPDGEAAVHGRLRRSEARWQRPPGAAADQDVDDRGKHGLIIDVRDPAALRTNSRRRQQRPCQLPQAVRNDPSPPSTPHRWTWLIIAAYTQLRLARPLFRDLRHPWEKPAAPNRLTPARVRRTFRNLHQHMACPARAPKPHRAGPGRPPGTKNRHRAPRYDVGKTVRREKTLIALERWKG